MPGKPPPLKKSPVKKVVKKAPESAPEPEPAPVVEAPPAEPASLEAAPAEPAPAEAAPEGEHGDAPGNDWENVIHFHTHFFWWIYCRSNHLQTYPTANTLATY